MNNNLQRISVSVDKKDYKKLKGFSKQGISTGFLIRAAIRDFLLKISRK